MAPELHGDGIHVHAKAISVGNERPYLLLLQQNSVLRDDLADLLLFPLEIDVSELVGAFRRGRPLSPWRAQGS